MRSTVLSTVLSVVLLLACGDDSSPADAAVRDQGLDGLTVDAPSDAPTDAPTVDVPGLDAPGLDAPFDSSVDAAAAPGMFCPTTERLGIADAVRFDSDGATRHFAVHANADGAIAFGGYTSGSVTLGDVTVGAGELFVAGLRADLSVDWVWHVPAGAGSTLTALARTDAGAVYAVGIAVGDVDLGDGSETDTSFVLHLTNEGAFDWDHRVPRTSNSGARGLLDVEPRGEDAVVLADAWNGTDFGNGPIVTAALLDWVLLGYASDGSLDQEHVFGSVQQDTYVAMDVDSSGEVFCAHSTSTNIHTVFKLRTDGTTRYSHSWEGMGSGYRNVEDVAVADDGTGYVIFDGRGSLDFGTGATYMFNGILLSLAPDGTPRWAREFAQSDDVTLIVDATGRPMTLEATTLAFIGDLGCSLMESSGGLLMVRYSSTDGATDGTLMIPGIRPGVLGLGSRSGERSAGGTAALYALSDPAPIDLGTGVLDGDGADPVVLVLP